MEPSITGAATPKNTGTKTVDEESEIKLKAIFDSSRIPIYLLVKKLEVLAFNKSAADFIRTTYKKKLALGDCIMDYTDPKMFKQFTKYFAYALSGRSIKREWMLMPVPFMPAGKKPLLSR